MRKNENCLFYKAIRVEIFENEKSAQKVEKFSEFFNFSNFLNFLKIFRENEKTEIF